MVSLKKAARKVSFEAHKLALRAGVFVLPVHFYVPLANVLELTKTRANWAKKSELPGIRADLDTQAATLQQVCLPYRNEYAGNPVYKEAVEQRFGPGYGYIEAQALHAVVRHYRPKRIIEVGSGVSTSCMLHAAKLNQKETGEPSRITCIEPYPSDALRELGDIELLPSKVQEVPMSYFEELTAGDFLFIDSSHTIRPGSEVNYLILEVLPRLAPGVLVHFHDIYLPYDYQRDVLESLYQWMETSLLRAYLTHNDRVEMIFSLSQLHYDRKAVLKEVFPEYRPAPDNDGLMTSRADEASGHYPSSIYFRT